MQEIFMRQALALAREAAAAGEVPVGCVVVREGVVVGRGRNRREETRSAASHAASLKENWHFSGKGVSSSSRDSATRSPANLARRAACF